MMKLRMLTVIAVLVTALPVYAQVPQAVPGRTITVRGEAEVKRAPDKADISIGIQEQKPELKEAQRLTDEQLKALYRIADTMGVTKKDLQTNYSSVQPVYHYRDGGQHFVGYSVNHQITVTLRDLDKLAEFTQKLLDAKIDQINNIHFGLQQEDAEKKAALKKALENARAKAEALAESSGERIEKVYAVNEGGVYFEPVPMPMMRGKAVMAMESASMDAAAAPPAGEMSVRADVQATFLLEE